jgi:hypothetical protein
MRRALLGAVAAVAAAAAACGSSVDLGQSCSMNVSVNGGAQQTVSCFAAGAFAPTTGNAVSIAMTGALANVQAAQFAMTLPSAPSAGTYTATTANVTTSAGQVQTTGGALYTQSKAPSVGTFSVVLTSVNGVSANGQTAYFLHGTATVTLAGQGTGAPGTATITATF